MNTLENDESLGQVKLTTAMNKVELCNLLLKDGVTICTINMQKSNPVSIQEKLENQLSKTLAVIINLAD